MDTFLNILYLTLALLFLVVLLYHSSEDKKLPYRNKFVVNIFSSFTLPQRNLVLCSGYILVFLVVAFVDVPFTRPFLGAGGLIFIAYLFSSAKRHIDWQLVGIGVALQILLGVCIYSNFLWLGDGLDMLSSGFINLLSFTSAGSSFIFGQLADPGGSAGMVFAFNVLPTIIFFSTLSAGLYYLGVLQFLVKIIASVMSKLMRLSGAESLSAAGNIFLGQTEAPLIVKPFIPKMTKSEIMCLMTGGMATIAGGVLASYVMFLGGDSLAEQKEFAKHLLMASFMSAPAAIVMAKIIVPETKPEEIDTDLKVNKESVGSNLIDAMSNGASDGLKLALNVGAMLLAFLAVVAMVNAFFSGVVGEYISFGDGYTLNKWVNESTAGVFKEFNMQYIFGQVFRFVAYLIGVDWSESLQVGSLIGSKTVINEFLAFEQLSKMKEAGALSEKAVLISAYALTGFSNFGSIAIQIGGIGGMAENQKPILSKLGLKALLGATLACLMTAAIAGALFMK